MPISCHFWSVVLIVNIIVTSQCFLLYYLDQYVVHPHYKKFQVHKNFRPTHVKSSKPQCIFAFWFIVDRGHLRSTEVKIRKPCKHDTVSEELKVA